MSLPQQENTILIFSFIGMESQEVPVGDPKKPIKVILKETAENLKEVVVTGIFTRKKESFTGSASTYTASELKTAGTQNILQRPFFCHSGQHLIRLRSEPPAEYGNPWEIEYAGYA